VEAFHSSVMEGRRGPPWSRDQWRCHRPLPRLDLKRLSGSPKLRSAARPHSDRCQPRRRQTLESPRTLGPRRSNRSSSLAWRARLGRHPQGQPSAFCEAVLVELKPQTISATLTENEAENGLSAPIERGGEDDRAPCGVFVKQRLREASEHPRARARRCASSGGRWSRYVTQ